MFLLDNIMECSLYIVHLSQGKTEQGCLFEIKKQQTLSRTIVHHSFHISKKYQ